jgi:nucleotide-binding universal stress UspA family protein
MTNPKGAVVVGVDGSGSAIRAARWAGAVARRLGAPLHIVHAVPYLGHNLSDAIAGIRASEMVAQHDSARAILAAVEHAVRADADEQIVTVEDLTLPADRALIELSRHARLVVLGGEAATLGSAILNGSITVTVVTHATCPVVTWRGDAIDLTNRPIVLGVDDDEDTRTAITTAFYLADRLGVGIIAVRAWSKRRQPGEVNLPFMIDWDAIEEDERQHLRRILRPWSSRYPDVAVNIIAEANKPSKALLNHASDAQLIVVGGRGRGLIAGAVLGSTGLNLLRHCMIPVMICHPGKRHVDRLHAAALLKDAPWIV